MKATFAAAAISFAVVLLIFAQTPSLGADVSNVSSTAAPEKFRINKSMKVSDVACRPEAAAVAEGMLKDAMRSALSEKGMLAAEADERPATIHLTLSDNDERKASWRSASVSDQAPITLVILVKVKPKGGSSYELESRPMVGHGGLDENGAWNYATAALGPNALDSLAPFTMSWPKIEECQRAKSQSLDGRQIAADWKSAFDASARNIVSEIARRSAALQ
jgi:hypothetical protein